MLRGGVGGGGVTFNKALWNSFAFLLFFLLYLTNNHNNVFLFMNAKLGVQKYDHQ